MIKYSEAHNELTRNWIFVIGTRYDEAFNSSLATVNVPRAQRNCYEIIMRQAKSALARTRRCERVR